MTSQGLLPHNVNLDCTAKRGGLSKICRRLKEQNTGFSCVLCVFCTCLLVSAGSLGDLIEFVVITNAFRGDLLGLRLRRYKLLNVDL